jgi:hypothetical protein
MDKGRKRVPLIAAAILATRKLAQYDGGESSGDDLRNLRCDPMGGRDYAGNRFALAGKVGEKTIARSTIVL